MSLTSLFIHSGLLVTENHDTTITNDHIMVKHWDPKGNSLQEKNTLPKKLLTIEIMHKRHSNYTVYISFKMLILQLNIPSEWIYVGISVDKSL